MSSWTGIPELKQSYRTLGARRFWAMTTSVLAYIGIGVWLSMTVNGWPEKYGSSCHGRGCLIDELWYSPGLLNGGWAEWMLFAWLWSMPGIVFAAFIYAFVTKRGIFQRN